jgi:hypothetical protein
MRKNLQQIAGVVIISAGVMAILIWFPEFLVNQYGKFGPFNREQYTRAVDDYRKTFAQIVGGLALLAGLYFTWRNVSIAEEGRITDRFTKAIDQLGANNSDGTKRIEVRLGGIYALERLARDSERDHGPVMEILTAYVRQNSMWKGKHISEEDHSENSLDWIKTFRRY